MKPPHSQLTVLHDTQEWTTDVEGEIGEIRVDGKKLNDIHDLAMKLDKSINEQRVIAVACTVVVCVVCVCCTVILATV